MWSSWDVLATPPPPHKYVHMDCSPTYNLPASCTFSVFVLLLSLSSPLLPLLFTLSSPLPSPLSSLSFPLLPLLPLHLLFPQDGVSAAFIAAQNGFPLVVQALLNAGADPNIGASVGAGMLI